jgi:hypothetical protein
MLSYHEYEKGCDARIEAPPDSSDQTDPLQPLADRLGVTVEELRRYMDNKKGQKQTEEKPQEA